MPIWAQAGCWGLLASSGLLLGALGADLLRKRLSHRTIAVVTGFGAGVLIAIATVNLMLQAFAEGNTIAASAGLLLGAATFSGSNWILARHGAQHRKRCGDCVQQASERSHAGSGMAIAIGTVLDGVPESLVIGLSIAGGGKIGIAAVAGFFLANIPQGLSGAAGMRAAQRSRSYIYWVWGTIPLFVGLFAAGGALLLGTLGASVPSAVIGFAGGAVLAMLAEVMIPEAFDHAPACIGLVTVLGCLTAFSLAGAHA